MPLGIQRIDGGRLASIDRPPVSSARLHSAIACTVPMRLATGGGGVVVCRSAKACLDEVYVSASNRNFVFAGSLSPPLNSTGWDLNHSSVTRTDERRDGTECFSEC